eukprot:TRINITY_DN4947_c0_g1_i2.p1 TRINITY_DN4947_c0_g1~~TRINITY_DN4947_c0_g1_i2.p1  ORF type:complete len:122 (-),score=13.72 TRINITY_DN4947_c0_g1_i2:113-478(-)
MFARLIRKFPKNIKGKRTLSTHSQKNIPSSITQKNTQVINQQQQKSVLALTNPQKPKSLLTSVSNLSFLSNLKKNVFTNSTNSRLSTTVQLQGNTEAIRAIGGSGMLQVLLYLLMLLVDGG